ncbi:MAG: hypothetical protein ACC661_01100 [Verrucomicrobiales bacterium]
MIRWVLVVLVLGASASSYVYIKNQHVARGNQKKAIEVDIARLEREIETIELRYASMMDRVVIHRKLQFTGSGLRKIDPRMVEYLEELAPVTALAADSQGGR